VKEELGEIQSRKPYQKPQIEQVKIVPEDTVMGGCKTTSYVINSFGETSGCGLLNPTPCYTDGS